MIKVEVKEGSLDMKVEGKRAQLFFESVGACSAILEDYIKATCKKGFEKEMLADMLVAIGKVCEFEEDK